MKLPTMKNLNVCITRFHWQQDDYMLSLMDEYGILVQEELPWWQQPAQLSATLEKTARKQLADNIEAHYNHPAIFSWGISNEVNGHTDKDKYIALRNYVKSQDSTRLVTVVSNRIWQKLENDETLLGDFPMWNEYIGTWHGIMDVFLNPKPSYSVLKQLASPIEITKVERVDNSTTRIEIKIKKSIPEYILRGYKIEYETIGKKMVKLELPVLIPGETYSAELKQINSRFAFKILRPTGFCVIQY